MANKKLESNENKKKLPGMKGYEKKKKDRKKMLAGFKSKRKDPGGKILLACHSNAYLCSVNKPTKRNDSEPIQTKSIFLFILKYLNRIFQ